MHLLRYNEMIRRAHFISFKIFKMQRSKSLSHRSHGLLVLSCFFVISWYFPSADFFYFFYSLQSLLLSIRTWSVMHKPREEKRIEAFLRMSLFKWIPIFGLTNLQYRYLILIMAYTSSFRLYNFECLRLYQIHSCFYYIELVKPRCAVHTQTA